MRMIPPRNLSSNDEPIATEDPIMGPGMRDPRVHSHESLKDDRPSNMDPLRDVPDDDITHLIDRSTPSPRQQVIIEGKIVSAQMCEGGASVSVFDGKRNLCVWVQGTIIIEVGMPVSVIAHFDPRNSNIVQRVTLARSTGGVGDEGD